jgi:hypothetical protein
MKSRVTVKFMRRAVIGAACAGLVLIGPVGTVRADDPPAPVQIQVVDSYGPGINPTVGTETPLVNPGDAIRVYGSDFCANTTVIATISPAVAGFPKTLTSDAQGKVTLTFAAPSNLGPYTVTLTGQPTGLAGQATDQKCAGSGSTVVNVVDVDSGGPVPDQNSSGLLPATGSSSAGLQLRNGIVAVLAGLGMVLVASRRRKATADWSPPNVTT